MSNKEYLESLNNDTLATKALIRLHLLLSDSFDARGLIGASNRNISLGMIVATVTDDTIKVRDDFVEWVDSELTVGEHIVKLELALSDDVWDDEESGVILEDIEKRVKGLVYSSQEFGPHSHKSIDGWNDLMNAVKEVLAEAS